jgi:RHS repeat-associated protein
VAGATGTYRYDGDGKRISKTVGATTTNYVYDIGSGLPVLLDDGIRQYVWTAGGLAFTVDKSTAAMQVYHTDGLGSVRSITDSTGGVVQTYQTDEFGISTVSQGANAQPFGFTGEQRDPEDGLVYLRARMYKPTSGRFMQRDQLTKSGPGVSGWNRYPYVGNNPAGSVDPSGLYSYRYEWYIGPVARTGNPVSVMTYFQEHPRQIFPFGLGQCDTIILSARCDLGAVPTKISPVEVANVTSTSFTFSALKDTSIHRDQQSSSAHLRELVESTYSRKPMH